MNMNSFFSRFSRSLILRRAALIGGVCGLLLTVPVPFPGYSQSKRDEPESAQVQAMLGTNVLVTNVAVRAWSLPETKFMLLNKVPEGAYYYLQMDGLSLGGGPSAVVSDEGAGDRAVALRTGNTFTRKGVKISPPKGKYLEVLLMFQNIGNETAVESITGQKTGELDITLSPSGGQLVHPIDFVATGFSTSRMSQLQDLQQRGLTVVSEFTGTISVYLEAGGKTWILALFDIPEGTKTGELRIRNSAPITISF